MDVVGLPGPAGEGDGVALLSKSGVAHAAKRTPHPTSVAVSVDKAFTAPPSAATRTRNRAIKLTAFAVYFVGTLASTVLGKKTTIAAPAYPYALTVLSPLAGLCVYPAVVVSMSYLGFIRKEQRQVPMWKCAVVGLLFCLHNVLENLGNRGNVVPGPIVLIILKSIVPITFVASYVVPQLRPRYRWSHYAGVAILLAGIAVALGGELSSLHGFRFSESLGYMVLLLSSVLPLAAAFVFIEVQLKHDHAELHPTVLWAYVCVFEALVSIPLAFVNAALQGISMSHVWSNATEGIACYVAGSPGGVQHLTSGDDAVTVACGEAQLWYLCGLLPGFAFNFAMPVCTKYGSATLLWFVRALALPVASVLFSLRFLMGSNASHMGAWEWGGLVMVFFATMLYNHFPAHRKPPSAAPGDTVSSQ